MYPFSNRITVSKSIVWVLVMMFTAFLFVLPGYAQATKPKNAPAQVIPSLNAFSFNDLLLAKDSRDKQVLYSVFNLMDWCASQHIDGLDLTGYYFPGYPAVPADDYIRKVKTRAAQLGITLTGTGIRNNFASPDPAVRAADVALAKKWIEVASKLGVPVLRVFSGEIPKGYENKWDEVAGWMIACYKECVAYAEKFTVKIGIQNHGDMLQTAEQCLKVLQAVNSPWAGLIVDTGNFKTEDPYADIEKVAPYAINWQVKESAYGIGDPRPTDYYRLMRIFKKQHIQGFVPVETLLVRGIPYDPFALVPTMISDLRIARDAVFTEK